MTCSGSCASCSTDVPPLRVLVAEDSPTARALLVEVLARDPALCVVGEARNGMDAVRLAEMLRPDVITMDVEMPVLDGLEATRQIMVQTPTPIVVVTALGSEREGSLSLDATEAGALCVARKPVSPLAPCFDAEAAALVATVKAMAAVKVVRRWRAASRAPVAPTPEWSDAVSEPPREPTRVVAIAASTGGPAALHSILRRLPADFAAPLVVVQHIAEGFTGAFASWLASGCSLPVQVAADGAPLRAGVVYVAPEGHHCGVQAGDRIALARTPAIGGFRPSATHLFETVAREYGRQATAVILTGMGADGVAGLRRVRDAGGRVIVQDEETSIVFGMPREAIAAGLATAILTPAAIAERLIVYVRGGVNG